MKLLTPEEVKAKKTKEEIAAKKRVDDLKIEEARLIKSINQKREELETLNKNIK